MRAAIPSSSIGNRRLSRFGSTPGSANWIAPATSAPVDAKQIERLRSGKRASTAHRSRTSALSGEQVVEEGREHRSADRRR